VALSFSRVFARLLLKLSLLFPEPSTKGQSTWRSLNRESFFYRFVVRSSLAGAEAGLSPLAFMLPFPCNSFDCGLESTLRRAKRRCEAAHFFLSSYFPPPFFHRSFFSPGLACEDCSGDLRRLTFTILLLSFIRLFPFPLWRLTPAPPSSNRSVLKGRSAFRSAVFKRPCDSRLSVSLRRLSQEACSLLQLETRSAWGSRPARLGSCLAPPPACPAARFSRSTLAPLLRTSQPAEQISF